MQDGHSVSGFSLSPQQRYLWSLGDQNVYRSDITIAIRGPVDLERLRTAAERLVGAHEILRTTFSRLPGMKYPVQVIRDDWSLDFEHCPVDQCDLETLTKTLRQRFSGASPVSRDSCHFVFCAQADSEGYLFVNLPSLCADADTLLYMASELMEMYGNVAGITPAPTPTQHADIADRLNSPSDLEQWPLLEDQRNVVVPFSYAAAPVNFVPELHANRRLSDLGSMLSERATSLGTSPEILAFACWGITLRRFLGKSEFEVGAYCSGRYESDLEGMLGPLGRYLPVPFCCDHRVTWGQLLASLTDPVSHEDSQIPGLKTGSKDLETASWLPLSFEYHSLNSRVRDHDEEYLVENLYSCSDRFKLKLSCAHQGSDLIVELHYDRSAFYLKDLTFLLRRFENVLRGVVAGRGEAAIALHLDDGFESEIASRAESTASPSGKLTLIPSSIQAYAAQDPERLAVSNGIETLTYGALDSQSDRIAASLISRGVRANECVGVCLPRTPGNVLAMLAILKAGAFFVSLDPTYPSEWLQQTVAACKIELILTDESLAAQLECLRNQSVPLSHLADGAFQSSERSSAERLAYIVFTSGSEGRPKGVEVGHRSLAEYISALQCVLRLEASDRYFHTASFSFSSSVRQLFWPLSQGASVFLANQRQRHEPLAFLEAINNYEISVIDIVPTFWMAVNDALSLLPKSRKESLLDNKLRMVLSASEPLMPEIVSTWRACVPKQHRIANMFGLTETTGIVAIEDLGMTSCPAEAVPIGKPLPGLLIYVLDEERRMCGVGEVGEIYVSGRALARDYLDDPSQTAQRFLPDCFSGGPGTRMFFTGDRGVYRPDGSLEYRGRSNYELKVRGHRIEPEYVERIIRKHPAVHEVVVTGQDTASDSATLVAYLVPEEAQRPTATELRHFLHDKLPLYMVPGLFALRSSLPRTLNGKIDRAAVSTWRAAAFESDVEVDSPNTEVETVLVKIWKDVLQLKRIGLKDDFFDLGGQSLLGVKLLARIRQELDVELDWTSLTDSPTITQLSERIDLFYKLSKASPPGFEAEEEGSL